MSNKEVIRKWVDALRSGEFEQTKGQLGRVEEDGSRSYCCLGVLCELAAREGVIESARESDCAELIYDFAFSTPPRTVDEWIGIDYAVNTPDELLDANDDYCDEIELTTLNDEEEFDFNQIADAIERTWLA